MIRLSSNDGGSITFLVQTFLDGTSDPRVQGRQRSARPPQIAVYRTYVGGLAPIHRRCSTAPAYVDVPQDLLPQPRFHWISRQEAGSCRVRSQQIVELSRQPLDPARQSFCDARELLRRRTLRGLPRPGFTV